MPLMSLSRPHQLTLIAPMPASAISVPSGAARR